MLTAQHNEFFDEHFKLAVAASDLVQDMLNSLTQDAHFAESDEDVDANTAKLSADQSLSTLKALAAMCRTMACQARALSERVQKTGAQISNKLHAYNGNVRDLAQVGLAALVSLKAVATSASMAWTSRHVHQRVQVQP